MGETCLGGQGPPNPPKGDTPGVGAGAPTFLLRKNCVRMRMGGCAPQLPLAKVVSGGRGPTPHHNFCYAKSCAGEVSPPLWGSSPHWGGEPPPLTIFAAQKVAPGKGPPTPVAQKLRKRNVGAMWVGAGPPRGVTPKAQKLSCARKCGANYLGGRAPNGGDPQNAPRKNYASWVWGHGPPAFSQK